jgi:two-component system, OmpR family, response regulator
VFIPEIILLDDDADITSVFCRAFTNSSLQVIGFVKPDIALAYYKEHASKIKLVISDIRMPEMNGFEFAYKVREINPKVKVLLITAYEHGDLESAGIYASPTLQIDEFIKKPILPSKLVEAAARHISIAASR